MATVEIPDDDLALLQRLLSSLSSNLNSDEMLKLPTEMWVFYVAVFTYQTISSGRTPDGRKFREALFEDVKRLRLQLDDRPGE